MIQLYYLKNYDEHNKIIKNYLFKKTYRVINRKDVLKKYSLSLIKYTMYFKLENIFW
jgi:phosphoribosyl-dephospho-CoA transferase